MSIDYKDYFENKQITKQGFGILGRGLGVVKFLLKNGVNLLITDNKEESFFKDQLEELKSWMLENKISESRVNFIFGEHRKEDFINCDYVIQASGVSKDNIFLKAAKDHNIPVYQESSLFLKILEDFNNTLREKDKVKVITVTGTRGKTTTTYLIYKILKDYFENFKKDRNIYLGGNIQGISTIELLENIKERDMIVMEADSWLAQGFEDIKFGPDVAVFTNLMWDHMNYYAGNMSDYFSDKAKTFLFQKEKDILIAEENLKKYLEDYLLAEYEDIYKNLKSQQIFIGQAEVDKDKLIFKSDLKGEHNRLNISLSIRVSEFLGVEMDFIKKSVEDFKGVSGRLEFVKEDIGVRYYNDTTATTGEATIAAIEAFKDDKSQVVLITGGRDKELEVNNYVEKLIQSKKEGKIKKIIFLNDATTTGTEKVLSILKEKDFNDYLLASNLEKAISLAKEYTKPGDIILFSPGFASFGMFANEYDRGEQFLKFI